MPLGVGSDWLAAELLLSAYACTVFHFVADMADQGVGVCLRISKYERQMGIPSFHSLSLSISLSQHQPLYICLGRWTQETSGTLLICCST